MYGYIYLIVNKLDGRTYLGKRKFRNKNQKWDTDGYMGSGCHLKNSQAKYGIENFEKFLITWTYSEEDAKKIVETKERRKAEGKVYKRTGWEKGHEPWNKDKKRDWPVSEQEHINRSLANKGKHLSDDVKKETVAKRNETLKAIDFHSNKGMHWKLVDGKKIYYKEEV